MSKQLDYIFSTKAIREQAGRIHERILSGAGKFEINEGKLDSAAATVAEITRKNYPDLEIPYHSRWGHFNVGGVQRTEKFFADLEQFDVIEQARIKFDLVIPSVLLDAGAGTDWVYHSEQDGASYKRSEGLAIASYHLFCSGAFSSNESSPWRADADTLAGFSENALMHGFQVSPSNPLLGVDGRTHLVRSLGRAVQENPEFFVGGRVGGLVDYLINQYGRESIEASDILKTVLKALGSIWPGRIALEGVNLGDVWRYPPFGEDFESLVPFHKLSQWLTYSLVEPLEQMGMTITGLNDMTGLAEYRNGGLFIDSGVLRLKTDPSAGFAPDSEEIIEWRALTIYYLDKIADRVRSILDKEKDDFPLVKVLEGGTWWAGRELASQIRKDGAPPLNITSDGTVF